MKLLGRKELLRLDLTPKQKDDYEKQFPWMDFDRRLTHEDEHLIGLLEFYKTQPTSSPAFYFF